MQSITLNIPDEILISLKKNSQEFLKEMLFITSMSLYQRGKLSSGRAAELAGIPRVQFLHLQKKLLNVS
jgi:predicted HTH domain antitoxin